MSDTVTTLSVRGMTCGNCVKHVDKAVRSVRGVSGVQIDLASGRVLVTHAPGTDLDAIGLTGKSQAIVVIANQADAVADGTEDPAVVIMTLPVPALSPVIVRRGEVSPPDLVVTSLTGEW